MRYYLDTEFIEDGHTIELVSIGVVGEDGRWFYAESADVDLTRANSWVQEHVLPHLLGENVRLPRREIARRLLEFIDAGEGRPEFWAYYADYDWVVVCQLFGTMMDLPAGWPRYCLDLKQLAVSLGDPELPQPEGDEEHFALADARWNARTHAWLLQRQAGLEPRVDLLQHSSAPVSGWPVPGGWEASRRDEGGH